MMWDHVMEHMRLVLLADPVLDEIFHGNYRKAGPSDLLNPVLEWTLLGDTETEVWAPMLVQFDMWTAKASDTRRAERRMRGMLHQGTSVLFDSYTMLSEYADGLDLATPNRSNFTGRGIRFRFSPLRQQFALPALGS